MAEVDGELLFKFLTELGRGMANEIKYWYTINIWALKRD